MKKKLSATMVLVIVLVTITTAALAVAAGKYFGWFDFYSEFYGVEVPEVAQQVMKDSGERQFTLGPVTFTVGELYCDGYTAMASAKISLAEGDDVVRIMTMHKSKGLQFPVVFCLGLEKGLNTGVQVAVKASEAPKCARCWNCSDTVGENSEYPDVCARCADVLKNQA